MQDKDDLLSKIRALEQREKDITVSTPPDRTTPVIRTLESDTNDLIKNDKLDKVHILAQQLQSSTDNQMDSIIQKTVQQAQMKRLIVLIGGGVFLALIIIGLIWYIMADDNDNVPLPIDQNLATSLQPEPTIPSDTNLTPSDPLPTPPPQSGIMNLWPAASAIAEYTGNVSRETNHIMIEVRNFNEVYAYLIRNEFVFRDLAESTFGYSTLGPFQDTRINEKDMRIADGETGALVYGFVGNNTILLISNSIPDWVQTASSL